MRKVLASVLLIFCTGSCIAQTNWKKPNIIIIYADDLGYGDLSSYGSEIPTPHIDKIGKLGLTFTQFYAAPVCTPSRYGLLTGRHPQRSMHQLTNALMPGDKNYLDTAERTIAEYLQRSGYQTAIVGKWHLGMANANSSPVDHGFDRFFGFKGGAIDYYYHAYGNQPRDWYVDNKPVSESGYATELLTNHAIRFISESRQKNKPFFLYLPYNAPHYGKTDTDSTSDGQTIAVSRAPAAGSQVINSLQAPTGYVNRFASLENKYRRVYAGMVASLDENIGRILDTLQSLQLLESTIIWFISDNGGYSHTQQKHASNGMLRGEKASLHEGGIRVPALVLWKGKIKAGQIVTTPACNLDLFPTICSIAKIGFDKSGIDGMDISDLIFHNKKLQRDFYWKFNQQTAIRSGKWKLVDGKELYDLDKDPGEVNDLATQHPEVVKKLQGKFRQLDINIDGMQSSRE